MKSKEEDQKIISADKKKQETKNSPIKSEKSNCN